MLILKQLFIKFYIFLREVIQSRDLLVQLAWQNFKSRYLGSIFGLFWAFLNPFITIAIFCVVFQVGFKIQPMVGVPFVLWLITGIVPWFFFVDAWAGGTNCLLEYQYLVKKVVFRTSLLPIVKILASIPLHLFFLILIVIVYFYYDFTLTFYLLQLPYYFFALVFLLLGLNWLCSALIVFLKDIGHLVAILIQFGFWYTPIFWSLDIMPENYKIFFELNPMYYIVNGYRDSFFQKVWFWQDWELTLYFWGVAIFLFVLGAFVFHRLRVHFADLL